MSKVFDDYLLSQSKEIQEAYFEVKASGKIKELIEEVKRTNKEVKGINKESLEERYNDLKYLAPIWNRIADEDNMIRRG